MRVFLDGEFFADWSDTLDALAEFSGVDVERLGIDPVAAEQDAQDRLTESLNQHLDSVARQRRYYDRFTCSLRAGYAGPFQAEGQAFAVFMDDCNIKAYGIMAQCRLGLRPIPTKAELIALMPVIVWPQSPIPPDAVALAAAEAAALEAVQ